MLIKSLSTLFLVSIVTLVGCNSSPKQARSPEPALDDYSLLNLILKEELKEGAFRVVRSETDTYFIEDLEEMQEMIEGVSMGEILAAESNSADDATELQTLYDVFIEKNKKPVKLELQSSPGDGYVIDYENKYRKYFEEDGGGWEKWYKENPKARGSIGISLPAYDPKTGYVIVYKGLQWHWLAGEGNLLVYKLIDGKLEKVGEVNLWVS